MGTNFTKKERTYQNKKPYSFRDLELSLEFKISECKALENDIKRLKHENATLMFELKKIVQEHKHVV